ncbi:MAG: HNH endonuclease signature motif containing protein [Bacilli bacterium]|uniref:HNH endonuclease signature motif containing protein n=1 Tax=Clostridium sp. TaxID=1506 RepID=UPI002FC8CAFE
MGLEGFVSICSIKGFEQCEHILVNREGQVFNKAKNTFVKKSTINTGYYTVSVGRKTVLVHRLVASLFCEREHDKLVVDHINSIRTDNRAENLRWVTTSENNKKAIRNKLNKPKKVKATCIKTGEEKIFNNPHQAWKVIGGNSSEIYRVCKGERRSTNGYRFEFID